MDLPLSFLYVCWKSFTQKLYFVMDVFQIFQISCSVDWTANPFLVNYHIVSILSSRSSLGLGHPQVKVNDESTVKVWSSDCKCEGKSLEGQDYQITHRWFCELFSRWTHVINKITLSFCLHTGFILFFSTIAHIHSQTIVRMFWMNSVQYHSR